MQLLIPRKIYLLPIKRCFWTWLERNFTKSQCDRLKKLGPDRACAEWLLRNGASVKWVNSENSHKELHNLPPEGEPFFIKEIDATESSVNYHGFPVLKFCTHLERIILHGCNFMENVALKQLAINQPPLLNYLQVSSCRRITEDGLISLKNICNLQRLVLYDLPFVRDKERLVADLKDSLRNCDVTYIYKNDS